MAARGEHRITGHGRRKRWPLQRNVIFNWSGVTDSYVPANEDDLTGFSMLGKDATIQYGMIKDKRDPAQMDDERTYTGIQISDDADTRFGDLT